MGSSLKGEWKLISVTDKITGDTYYKPAGSSSDIIIIFTSNRFSGHTLRNDFSNGVYTFTKGTDLQFGSYAMTQIAEEQWGTMFLTTKLLPVVVKHALPAFQSFL